MRILAVLLLAWPVAAVERAPAPAEAPAAASALPPEAAAPAALPETPALPQALAAKAAPQPAAVEPRAAAAAAPRKVSLCRIKRLARAAARARAAAVSPGRALNAFYDLEPGQAVQDPVPVSLEESARPWRTQTQLAKLSKTSREPGKPFQFSIIGDAEPGRFWIWRALFNVPGVFARLLQRADQTPCDFIIQLGDMVSRGTPRNFSRFFALLGGASPAKPYLTLIGNHDRWRPHGVTNSRLYRALFGDTDYHFDRGGVRFVALDSSAGRLTPKQLAWLDRALDTPLRKIVFTHMPPDVLSRWTHVAGVSAGGGFKKGSREFADIVSRRGVERVYMGHIHGLGVIEHKGVRYVLTGGGGSPLFPSKVPDRFHHFLTVDVRPEGLRETVHRADGSSFVLSKKPQDTN